MLQTWSRENIICTPARVSSPQGNATNGEIFYASPSSYQSFKSPRECYKLSIPVTGVVTVECFKSPRECYKLFHIEDGGQVYVCFKSPRECYKHYLAEKKGLNDKAFQVPKGMLQTISQLLCIYHFHTFQVPKGMLQTGENETKVNNSTVSFKSPRECYKPIQRLEYTPLHGVVSSPQGNATNLTPQKVKK